MSDEPTYPGEAAVGAEAAKQSAVDAAAEADAAEADATEAGAGKRKQYVKAGVAVGIGSAAIVAALLYANRGRRGGDKGNG
jgi:hypothetical protein